MLLTESERLFQKGMTFYQVEKYKQAIKYLSLAVEKEPENAEFIFLPGTRCFTGKTDRPGDCEIAEGYYFEQ